MYKAKMISRLIALVLLCGIAIPVLADDTDPFSPKHSPQQPRRRSGAPVAPRMGDAPPALTMNAGNGVSCDDVCCLNCSPECLAGSCLAGVVLGLLKGATQMLNEGLHHAHQQ